MKRKTVIILILLLVIFLLWDKFSKLFAGETGTTNNPLSGYSSTPNIPFFGDSLTGTLDPGIFSPATATAPAPAPGFVVIPGMSSPAPADTAPAETYGKVSGPPSHVSPPGENLTSTPENLPK